MKKDISTRADIELMVNSFYEKVNKDSLISPFFTEVVHVHWEQHLPRMYEFWESLLLDTNTFEGNPMQAHIRLNEKKHLEKEHFTRWLELFENNINELFQGEVTEKAKQRARSIAMVIELKTKGY